MSKQEKDQEKVRRAMVELGWSPEGAAFITSVAPEDPKFWRHLKMRMLGIKLPRFRSKKKRKAKIPGRLRKAVMERDAYRCQHCGDWHDLTLDHIIPESKGGPTTFENLQVLCRSCNSTNGTSVEAENE